MRAQGKIAIFRLWPGHVTCRIGREIAPECYSALTFDAGFIHKLLNLLRFGIQDPAPTHNQRASGLYGHRLRPFVLTLQEAIRPTGRAAH